MLSIARLKSLVLRVWTRQKKMTFRWKKRKCNEYIIILFIDTNIWTYRNTTNLRCGSLVDIVNECHLVVTFVTIILCCSSLTVTKLEKRKDIHKFQITTKQSLKKDITYQVEILFDGTLGSDSSSPFYQSTYSNSKHSQQKKSVVINSYVWLGIEVLF